MARAYLSKDTGRAVCSVLRARARCAKHVATRQDEIVSGFTPDRRCGHARMPSAQRMQD